jgi:Uma2 family endonuclease
VTEAIAHITFDEFLAAEIDSDVRHELVGGRVYAMAGGTDRHDLAAQLLYEMLVVDARRRGCRSFIGNRLLRTPADVTYYPDLMIVCGPPTDQHYETTPELIVEIASPSTINVDRREKAIAYAGIDTLAEYVIVEPVMRRIEVATRTGDGWAWRPLGPGDILFAHGTAIDVDTFYDLLDADATRGQ